LVGHGRLLSVDDVRSGLVNHLLVRNLSVISLFLMDEFMVIGTGTEGTCRTASNSNKEANQTTNQQGTSKGRAVHVVVWVLSVVGVAIVISFGGLIDCNSNNVEDDQKDDNYDNSSVILSSILGAVMCGGMESSGSNSTV